MLDAATTTALASANWSDYHQCYGNSPRTGWIVATTHAQAERYASSNLQLRGYVTYLPLVAARIRDRVTPTISRIVQRPLWPGYLFVRYDSRDPRRPIRETPGVRDIVRCGSEIQWAPEAQIRALQAGEAARRCLTAETSQWAPGTPVAVANGVLQNCHGVVVASHTDRNMATVAIMMAGHLCRLLVHTDHLVPAGETVQ